MDSHGRRALLRAVPAVGAAALAGCSALPGEPGGDGDAGEPGSGVRVRWTLETYRRVRLPDTGETVAAGAEETLVGVRLAVENGRSEPASLTVGAAPVEPVVGLYVSTRALPADATADVDLHHEHSRLAPLREVPPGETVRTHLLYVVPRRAEALLVAKTSLSDGRVDEVRRDPGLEVGLGTAA